MAERSQFVVREATEADIPLLIEARRRMFDDMGEVFIGDAFDAVDSATATFIEERLGRGPVGFVAEDGAGAWVGTLSVSHEVTPPSRGNPSGRHSYVYGLWVDPAVRRQGVGRALVSAVIESARRLGEGGVTLYASDLGRPLYESLGFNPAPAMRLFFAPLHDPDAKPDDLDE